MQNYDPIKAKIYRDKRKEDATVVQRMRAFRRKSHHKNKTDPEWLAKKREHGRKLGMRTRMDPEKRAICNARSVKWAHSNRPHLQMYNKQYRNLPTAKLRTKHNTLKRKYGLTLEQYEAKLAKQNGLCPICAKPITKPTVDHNHATGQVRAILCDPCNRGLSTVENQAHLLSSMQQYLETWNKQVQ